MKAFLFIIGFIICVILGAIAHERDLARNCRRDGITHSFTVEINCSEMKSNQ